MRAKEIKNLEDIVENVHNLGACKIFLTKTKSSKRNKLIFSIKIYNIYQKTPIRKKKTSHRLREAHNTYDKDLNS